MVVIVSLRRRSFQRATLEATVKQARSVAAASSDLSTVTADKSSPLSRVWDVITNTKVKPNLRSSWFFVSRLWVLLQVPQRYHVRCRVLAVWPSEISEFTYFVPGHASLGSGSGLEATSSQPAHKYFFSMCLDDGTGSLVAVVCDKDAVCGDPTLTGRTRFYLCWMFLSQELFLPGMPPVDFKVNSVSAQLLSDKVGVGLCCFLVVLTEVICALVDS
jgi:hypothetical protein